MNIIDAITRLVENPVTNLKDYKIGSNRVNNMGAALEEYIKDLFAGSFGMEENERVIRLSEVFSYLGNNSNPPDAMLKDGDAIEVKKIESNGSSLALNSSYPKQTLKSTSTMISAACKDAEWWTEKDMIYAVGFVKDKALKRHCMVYGMDYCASEECYAGLKRRIKNGVEEIPNVDFQETAELGRVNRVDPLGITYMRVRGMWGIENPWTAFHYLYNPEKSDDTALDFMCIINEDKWEKLGNAEQLREAKVTPLGELNIEDVQVRNPDNPSIMRPAKLITFTLKAAQKRGRRKQS